MRSIEAQKTHQVELQLIVPGYMLESMSFVGFSLVVTGLARLLPLRLTRLLK